MIRQLSFAAGVAASMALTGLSAQHAMAEQTPASFCAETGFDDTLRPIPPALVPEVNAVLGTRMPPATAIATTVFRCVNRHVAVCATGANLVCGKANQSRDPGPGVASWCRDNPDTSFVPAYVTGHDTIYAWQCRAGRPRIERAADPVDARGFIARNWKTLPAPH